MVKFFVPYSQNEPAAIEVNGHRLIIVTTEQEDLTDELEAIGGDEVREIELRESDANIESEVLAELAAGIQGGVVLTPPGISPSLMIESLSKELPWIH